MRQNPEHRQARARRSPQHEAGPGFVPHDLSGAVEPGGGCRSRFEWRDRRRPAARAIAATPAVLRDHRRACRAAPPAPA